MSVGKYSIFLLALLNIVDQIDSLKALPNVEDNDIKKTADIIRSTTNNLFSAFKLKGKKDNPKMQYLSVLHNYLTSLSLLDYTTLREIAKLSRVDKAAINNRTADFIVGLNEMGAEFNNNEYEFHTNTSLPMKEHIERIWKIRNLKFGGQGDYANTTVGPEHNVTLEEWSPHPILSNSRRIYKGRINKIRYFPFMVSVHIMNKFACGGSIIKSDLIITAASCLQLAYNNKYFREKPNFLSVRVGSSFYGVGGEKIEVMEIFFHPNYVPKFLHHNLAIMRLVRHIRFWKHRSVKKIKFDMDPHDLAADISGIIIIGWGATSPSDIVKSPWVNRLSSVKLEFYPFADCQSHYGKDFVTRTNFCLGYFSKGEGACNKDAGGPAIFNGELLGVISFGAAKCGTPDSPTVITKLGYYNTWITKIMAQQQVPHIKSRTTPVPNRQTVFYPLQKKIIKTTKRRLQVPKETLRPVQQVLDRQKPEEKSSDNLEAFNTLVKQMFPEVEVERAMLRTNQLVSALQPLKLRPKKSKIVDLADYNNEGKTLPQFTLLYSNAKAHYSNHPLVEHSQPIQRPQKGRMPKKHIEVISDTDINDLYNNFNKLADSTSTSHYYTTMGDINMNPTFRELLIEDDANIRQEETPAPHYLNNQNQELDGKNVETVMDSRFAPVTKIEPPPQETVLEVVYDETPPTTKAVELIQTEKLPMIDFDGDRTGLKSHLYDRSKLYSNTMNRWSNLKSDFKEVVITDPSPAPAPADLNSEFSYQKDILPLLAASKIPLYSNPKPHSGSRDFGLPEMEMFGDVVPYNKNPSADNPNLPMDSVILKQLYNSGNPMKELQNALLFDATTVRATTNNVDLNVFMLPEKRRNNRNEKRPERNSFRKHNKG